MHFDLFYKEFIGFNDKNYISSCIQRTKPLNENFYYPFIKTLYKNKVYISASPEIHEKIKESGEDDKDIFVFLKYIQMRHPSAKIKKFLRFSGAHLRPDYHGDAVIFREEHKPFFMRSGKNLDPDFKEKKWQQLKPYLEQQHFFAVLKDNKMVSSCKISDICGRGANLIVYTDENYRQKGYGKQVVHLAAEQCLLQNLIPIYFAEENNTASIHLARSLNFELKAEETSICYTK